MAQGAVDVNTLSPGALLQVDTRTRRYRIECLGGDAILLSGHPIHCPAPVPAHIHGSVDKEGSLEAGLIQPGMRLIVILDDSNPITTSKVVSIQLDTGEVRV